MRVCVCVDEGGRGKHAEEEEEEEEEEIMNAETLTEEALRGTIVVLLKSVSAFARLVYLLDIS